MDLVFQFSWWRVWFLYGFQEVSLLTGWQGKAVSYQQQGARQSSYLYLTLEDLTAQLSWMQLLTLHHQLLSLITVGRMRKASFRSFGGNFWATGGWTTFLHSMPSIPLHSFRNLPLISPSDQYDISWRNASISLKPYIFLQVTLSTLSQRLKEERVGFSPPHLDLCNCFHLFLYSFLYLCFYHLLFNSLYCLIIRGEFGCHLLKICCA